MPIHIFGLTGGIGSGKSTVAARFRERALPVIDADELARAVVKKGTDGLQAIVAEFGSGVLDAAGELDRQRVAAIVFADETARRKLNAITHPRVAARALEVTRELEIRGQPLACYEVPLLVESGLTEALRPLVVVVVDEEAQILRASQRDASTAEQVLLRIRAQMPLARKAELADYVIDNSGDVASTRARADEVLDAICARFGIDASRYPK